SRDLTPAIGKHFVAGGESVHQQTTVRGARSHRHDIVARRKRRLPGDHGRQETRLLLGDGVVLAEVQQEGFQEGHICGINNRYRRASKGLFPTLTTAEALLSRGAGLPISTWALAI